MELEASYACPSCGEEIVIPVDPSAGSRQDFVEDCPVCCSPVHISIELDGDEVVAVSAQAE